MPTTKKAAPYSLLARFYDLLTPHAPRMNRYARRKILGVRLRRRPRPRRGLRSVCDLACGSGATALELARAGTRVFAVDNSPVFCRALREKARRACLPLRVRCADMRSFRLPEPVDLLTCEFAALNHLPRHADLLPAFRAVARALRPGGWFYFDVNTCRSFAQPINHWFETPDFKLALHGSSNARRRRAILVFEWFLPQGESWRHVREHIPHICWSDAEIRSALRRAGFRSVRHWDGARVRPRWLHPRRGFDSYYLARKPAGKNALRAGL